MANVNLIPANLSEAPDLTVASEKSGEHYDNCPCCGSRDVEPYFKNQQGSGDSEQFDFSLYNCDSRDGGCGLNWDRTTGQGAARNASRGMNTKRLTQGANKLVTMPGLSPAYCRGYDAIQNHGEPLGDFASPYKTKGRDTR